MSQPANKLINEHKQDGESKSNFHAGKIRANPEDKEKGHDF